MKNFVITIVLCLLFTCTAYADLKVIDNTAQFEEIIQNSQVPVVVKFSAYWWGACQTLKNRLEQVATNYSDDQVLICTVDAYVNSDLKQYLLGGYPTVRVFTKGKTSSKSFVGSKDISYLTNFINEVIEESTSTMSPLVERGQFLELQTTAEFENLIQNSQVPVVVKFSAYWWGACKTLKNTLVNVAANYSDEQVLLCTVDAYVNSDLKQYLLGGYPTVRVFTKGKTSNKSFVGSKNASFVTNFVDDVIAESKNNNEEEQVAIATDRSNLIEINSVQQFEEIIQNSQVPVVVKFSAYWWTACTRLKNTLIEVSSSYSADQVLICTVDAYVHSELKQYLLGGYPTVRVFTKGKTSDKSFVGSKSDSQVRAFIDSVIGNDSQE